MSGLREGAGFGLVANAFGLLLALYTKPERVWQDDGYALITACLYAFVATSVLCYVNWFVGIRPGPKKRAESV